MGLVNRPRTLKLWSIAHKITHKTRKLCVFFVMPLKHQIDLVNCTGTPKMGFGAAIFRKLSFDFLGRNRGDDVPL
jgi:hypothetical protein